MSVKPEAQAIIDSRIEAADFGNPEMNAGHTESGDTPENRAREAVTRISNLDRIVYVANKANTTDVLQDPDVKNRITDILDTIFVSLGITVMDVPKDLRSKLPPRFRFYFEEKYKQEE